MKIIGNWALGVTVLYGGFALFLIGFLIISTFNKVDLVEDNYYDKEIAYQEHIDKVKRTKALTSPMVWKRDKEDLVLQFPKELNAVKGTVKLYRPSDSGRDVVVPIRMDQNNRQFIALNNLERGLWRMQVNWQADSVAFYNEDILFIE